MGRPNEPAALHLKGAYTQRAWARVVDGHLKPSTWAVTCRVQVPLTRCFRRGLGDDPIATPALRQHLGRGSGNRRPAQYQGRRMV